MPVLSIFTSRRPYRKLHAGCAWLLTVLMLAAGPELAAQTAPAKEYEVKAVFLFNFAQFTEWPPDAFAEPQAPLVIGVLGEDPFGAYLDATVHGEKVNNRPLLVQRYHRLEDVKTCHILFISRSEAAHLDQILGGLKGRNILSVADMDNFAQRGGIIQFTTEKNKIRLKINLTSVKAASLTLSSKLLKAAEAVTTPEH